MLAYGWRIEFMTGVIPFLLVLNIILTIGSVMTFISLFYSPETKGLHLDPVGRIVGEPGTAELGPEFAGTGAD
jgi:hypothetical protein